MEKKYYTGIGSRKTPPEMLSFMKNLATCLNLTGYTLRSGGAGGADKAFEEGASDKKAIYLAKHATKQAMDIAAQFHPAWDKCNEYVKMLHGRNAFQVLGQNLDNPSLFLICWTPDGCCHHNTRTIKTGGTGTAISIASHYKVMVYNLKNKDHYKLWCDWIMNPYWKGIVQPPIPGL